MGFDRLRGLEGLREIQGHQSTSETLASIATQLFQQTDPLRRGFIGQAEQFLGGGFDVTQTPEFGAIKEATESQFDLARQQVLETTPTGGALIDALTNIEQGRATALTQGIGDLAREQGQRAFSLATGAPLQTAVGAQSAAEQIAANLQAAQISAEAGESAATKGALGFGVGSLLGGK